MVPLILSFLFLFLLGCSSSTNPDDSLPVYLRGMHWNKVQEYLKVDLSLSDAVVPRHYDINLEANVRGHAGAERSNFNGTVTILLDIIRPIDRIELHSNGLIIEKAWITKILSRSDPVGVTEISSDPERETITVHVNRTIRPGEEFMLLITYNGVAKQDQYGLYESWDPKYNKSLDSNGPFILASNNFPTGARFWFPCFDEPAKKATFKLQVNHPSGLNVYSNADVERIEHINNARSITVFEKTKSLPTYQVALSINHLSVQSLDVDGFEKVRLICSGNSHEFLTRSEEVARSYFSYLTKFKTDIPAFMERNLELLSNLTIAIPKEKLDIIILEGTFSHTIQPGLITIGRLNFFDPLADKKITQDDRNLTQLLVGNLLTVRSTNQIWLNDMFSHFFFHNAETHEDIPDISEPGSDEIFFESMHEPALLESLSYPTTTKQFLASTKPLPSMKASHILKLISRLCSPAEAAMKKYLASSIDGFADIGRFIDTVSKACEGPADAREFLEDFIYQPGKAFLKVKRTRDAAIITQTRYHSTYFNADLRDNKTRYTIPIFYSIDGKSHVEVFHKNDTSLKITVPEATLFLIDPAYDHLYLVFYEDLISMKNQNFTDEEKERVFISVRKSMLAAFNIGYEKYEQIYEQLKYYIKSRIFNEDIYYTRIFFGLEELKSRGGNSTYFPDVIPSNDYSEKCEGRLYDGFKTTWDGLLNNDTTYWISPIKSAFTMALPCMYEWSTDSLYRKFLELNFLSENTSIRPDTVHYLPQRAWSEQWRYLHRFFFRNAGNVTNHRFDLLAEKILSQRKTNTLKYPDSSIRWDYMQELREFVIRNPSRAASMSTEIAMRLEREYIHDALPKYFEFIDHAALDAMFKEMHVDKN